ncbi:MAG: c-type cytochrome [Ferruginibacter sp.]
MEKTLFKPTGLVIFSIMLLMLSCSNAGDQKDEKKAIPEKPTNEEIIKKGQQLVTIMGCNDCHSPKKMGPMGPEIIGDFMLSGFPYNRPIVKVDNKLIKEGFPMFYPDLTAAAGPWGVSFAANLTPDETGIGGWTEEQFNKALTKGKLKGLDSNRTLLPPMPWINFENLSNDEVHAIFTYLKSIKPVKNIVPPAISPDKM